MYLKEIIEINNKNVISTRNKWLILGKFNWVIKEIHSIFITKVVKIIIKMSQFITKYKKDFSFGVNLLKYKWGGNNFIFPSVIFGFVIFGSNYSGGLLKDFPGSPGNPANPGYYTENNFVVPILLIIMVFAWSAFCFFYLLCRISKTGNKSGKIYHSIKEK
ncbi:hypothetical protein MTHERMOG20_23220 [Moorella thermoacetica]|uniref:hypothetical protein n=1 Tax=Neomoorella thermoacetica TaxID=1525 RepID=UPI0000540244|nr:hypothetical protein [Moorella thermoacetica]AKX95710.1 hypothetical protein MOTHA_c03410 [Moorella thermoacetica]OIQ54544.1 hypothetical protein MOCA_22130 [Moorella thermoacetica]QCZ99520.1 hypothetical protein MothHH_00350 [Moorella thermoacetica]TYL07179.1 hypothetical protein MOOCA_22870 [Moorella thermoacetica]TYL07546.1 hypothetical protein MOLA_22070 [Moorella thermoacetica]